MAFRIEPDMKADFTQTTKGRKENSTVAAAVWQLELMSSELADAERQCRRARQEPRKAEISDPSARATASRLGDVAPG